VFAGSPGPQAWSVDEDTNLIGGSSSLEFIISKDPNLTTAIWGNPTAAEQNDSWVVTNDGMQTAGMIGGISFPLFKGEVIYCVVSASGPTGRVQLNLEP
jgi:hypothetical protein